MFDQYHSQQSDAPLSSPVATDLGAMFDQFHAKQEPSVNELLGNPTSRGQAAARAGTGQVIKSIPFNVGDELFGAMGAGYDMIRGQGNTYDQRLEQARNLEEAARQTSPFISGAGELAANLAVPIKSAIGLKSGALAKTAQAAKEGGKIGALYGFGEGEDGLTNRAYSAGKGALWGAGTSGTLTAASQGINALANSYKNAAPEVLAKGLGIQYGDRVKGLNRVNLFVDDAGNTVPYEELGSAASIQAPVQQQVKSIKDAGLFDNATNDVQGLKIHLTKNKQAVGREIRSLSNEAHTAYGDRQILPTLEKTDEFLNGYNSEEKAKLANVLDAKWNDYLKTPGTGFKKLTKFLDGLQKETEFDAATPKAVTKLKRFLAYDVRKSAEQAFDEALPGKAGKYAKANDLFSSLESIGKTLNKPLARPAPSLGDYLKGGSLPMTVATGALSAPLGVGPAAALVGGKIAYNSAKKYSEAAFPITVSSAYEKIAQKLATKSGQLGTLAVPAAGAALIPGSRQSVQKSSPAAIQSVTPKQIPTPKADITNKTPIKLGEQKISLNKVLDVVEKVESNGNPRAVSKAGAKGAYQFTDATAKDYGLSDPYNRAESRKAASRKLTDDYGKFGQLELALAAYNAGAGRVDKLLKKRNGNDFSDIEAYLPTETQNYVRKIAKILRG